MPDWNDILKGLKDKKGESSDDKARIALKYIYNLHAKDLFENDKKFDIPNQADCNATGFAKAGNIRKRNFCKLNDVKLDQETGNYTLGKLWKQDNTMIYNAYQASQGDSKLLQQAKTLLTAFETNYANNYSNESIEKIRKDLQKAEDDQKNLDVGGKEKACKEAQENLKKLTGQKKSKEEDKKKKEDDHKVLVGELETHKRKMKDAEEKLKAKKTVMDDACEEVKKDFMIKDGKLKCDDNRSGACTAYSTTSYEDQRKNALSKVKEKYQADIDKFQSEIDKETKAISETQEKIKKNEELQTNLKKDIDNLQENIKTSEKNLQEKKDAYKNAKNNKIGDTISQLKNNLKDAEERLKKLQVYFKTRDAPKVKEVVSFDKLSDIDEESKSLDFYKPSDKIDLSKPLDEKKCNAKRDVIYAKLKLLANTKVENIDKRSNVKDHLILLDMILNNKLGNTIANLSKYESNQKSFTAENNSFAPFRIYKYSWSPNTQEEDFAVVLQRKQKKSKFKNLRY